MVDHIFNLLDDWRQLPNYQLERRADIFFASFLPKIIENKLGIEATCIIPEFPLMKGLYEAPSRNMHLSTKVDFLIICEAAKKVLFVELKTDMGSIGKDQLERMNTCAQLPVRRLVEGVLLIHKKSNSKKKYEYLLRKLEAAKWLKKEGNNYNVSCDGEYLVEVVYIQPTKYPGIKHHEISFEEISTLLKQQKNDPVALRFANSLVRWKDSMQIQA